jgi:hypothetical protein
MDEISGYIVANAQGGYDVIGKTSTTSTKPFTIPTEELTGEKQTQKILNNADTNPFDASSFNFKDWCSKLDPIFGKQMLTKTEPTRSDEEILKDMAELARKHARQGTFHEQDKEYLDLYKEYVSPVSPDREGILNRAVNEIIDRTKQDEDYTMSDIYQQVRSQTADKKEEEDEEKEKKELLDYFLEMLANKGNKKGSSGTISSITRNGDCCLVTIDNGGGMTTTLGFVNGEFSGMQMHGNNYSGVQLENGGMVGSVEHAMFKDDNGNLIAIYYNKGHMSGLRSAPTNEEIERQKEVLAAYNAGYDFAIGRNLTPPSSESHLKEIYNNTYDNLAKSAFA